MPRQPLLPVYSSLTIRFSSDPLRERPLIASVIAQCIGMWTQVEIQMALLLSAIMKANTEPSMAVFLSMRNSRNQRDALDAAAKTVLRSDELETYLSISGIYKSLETQRNDLAHGAYGISDDLVDAVLWMEPRDHASYTVKIINKIATKDTRELSLIDSEMKKKMFVYRLSDIQRLAEEIHAFWQLAFGLGAYLRDPDNTETRELYMRMRASPQIQQFRNSARQTGSIY